MTSQYTQARAAADHIRTLTSLAPRIGIILGSGLGGFARHIHNPTTIPYSTIPDLVLSTVEGHAGNLILGTIAQMPVVVLEGRIHAYEGYTADQITLPTRVLGLLGCRTLIVTNASGGIHLDLNAGDLALISDHINFTGINAAAGPNEPRFALASDAGKPSPSAGQRFFDMSDAYSPALRALAQTAAEQTLHRRLPESVYLAVLGPSFETPAEIRAFRTLGADLVGMSTVHEVIVARHMGIEVLGISLVTNKAAGILAQPIDHTETIAVGRRAEAEFTALLKAILAALPRPA